MKQNELKEIECVKGVLSALTTLSLLKSRGRPEDHKKAVEIIDAMLPVLAKLKEFLEEDVTAIESLPENVVAFVPKGKLSPEYRL